MCELIGIVVQKQINLTNVVQLTHVYKKGALSLWIVPSVSSVRLVKTAVQELCRSLLPFDPRVWMVDGDLDKVLIELDKDWGPFNVMMGGKLNWQRVQWVARQYGIQWESQIPF